MDRRSFLRGLVGGVAVGAAVRQWPFRVYSFPSKFVVPVLADEVFQPSPTGFFFLESTASGMNDFWKERWLESQKPQLKVDDIRFVRVWSENEI